MKERINIIFLDIDGVLNSEQFHHNSSDELTWDTFNPESVKYLNKLTDSTNAKIIISSDWRKNHSFQDLNRIFKENKIKGNVIGCTPILRFKKEANINIVRGIEINQALLNIQQAKPDADINYVILDDDDSGILLSQKDFFVKINPLCGFTEKDCFLFTMLLLRKND